jgi:predicted GNAT family acetyltransferase
MVFAMSRRGRFLQKNCREMKVTRHHDLAEFARRVLPMLMRDEATNNWTLGFLADGGSGLRTTPANELLMYSIEEDDGGVIATAVSTGESLVLTEMPSNAIAALAEFLQAEGTIQPKTSGPSKTASAFARLWAKQRGLGLEIGLRMGIMRLERVIRPSGINGEFRIAGSADVDKLSFWGEGFVRELGIDVGKSRHDARHRIEMKRLYVWCDPEPVSMAASVGPTPNGVRINFVYTPPEMRGRGYARACVASLSQMLLDSGKKFVFLFVDAENPITNRLYRAIGNEPVGDWEDWRFVSPEAAGK